MITKRPGRFPIMTPTIHIGTSGWHYDHWKGVFYPEKIPAGGMLAFYARHFMAAEINNSFYKLPETETLEAWRKAVPEGFLFAVKASRYITHMKKLKDPDKAVANFLARMAVLGDHLGPVLFQLPPHWNSNPDRLRQFIPVLPRTNRYAFEFRDPSWFNDEVFGLLENAGAAFCIYDLAGRTSPKTVTANFVYVRLHGPGRAYEGSYSQQLLSIWAESFSSWENQGKEVFCFFDNDQRGFAPANAKGLLEMLPLN